ncbi:MAG: tRNA pseudouridine(55) synthase TruB [Alicyclobacillaceae bacterium]|nr:tRNA pseudouridine(55) synthase TruB [Alicyclobacillaceae bacterium]
MKGTANSGCGVLVVDKPAGITSHDVVVRVRRRLGVRRVGHAGTLDPDATGILVLCVGEATRLLEYVVAETKVYEGVVTFGIATDTDDASGRELARQSAARLTESHVKAAAAAMVGRIRQRPPVYSAVHVQGRRAYEWARVGERPELPEREVFVHRFDIVRFSPGEQAQAQFVVECSKGTYVRALCRDLGAGVGVPAHMSSLRRVQTGGFHISEAVSLSVWEQSPDPWSALLPALEALRGWPQVEVSAEQSARLAAGQVVRVRAAHPSGDALLKKVAAVCDGLLVAVCEMQSVHSREAQLKPVKVFWKRDVADGSCRRQGSPPGQSRPAGTGHWQI